MSNWNQSVKSHLNTVLVLAVLLGFVGVGSAYADNNQKAGDYGRKLVAQYSLDSNQIARFAKFVPPAENLKELNPVSSLSVATEDWIGPPLAVERESGPYTVVVTLTGKSRYRGDVSTMWNFGWAVDGGTRMTAFPGLSKLDVNAGDTVVIKKAAAPNRFKDSQTVSVVLALVKAENFDFEKVDIEVWSGVADNSWRDVLMSFRWLALGLIVFLLRYFWVRR